MREERMTLTLTLSPSRERGWRHIREAGRGMGWAWRDEGRRAGDVRSEEREYIVILRNEANGFCGCAVVHLSMRQVVARRRAPKNALASFGFVRGFGEGFGGGFCACRWESDLLGCGVTDHEHFISCEQVHL